VFGAWNHWLWALDRATGSCRWRFNAGTYLDSGACAADGGDLFVPTMGPRFYCLDAATGQERWRLTDTRLWTTNASPAVTNEYLVIMAFTGGGHPYEPYRIETQCRDRHSGQLIWTYPAGGLNGQSLPMIVSTWHPPSAATMDSTVWIWPAMETEAPRVITVWSWATTYWSRRLQLPTVGRGPTLRTATSTPSSRQQAGPATRNPGFPVQKSGVSKLQAASVVTHLPTSGQIPLR
jgi:hypothetical protein